MNKLLKSIVVIASLVITTISVSASDILPITGSWVNLFYQDVRNKYTNPENMDNTDPDFWQAKIREMHNLGIEYIIFMATANEGKAAYPSKIMPHNYNRAKKSPVCAIMDEADKLGMKVLMSIGWAKNQDDNLRIPAILQRQKDIMSELASIYGNRRSFYGWYLPVEDCLGPVLTDAAVIAVNSLVEKAHKLTPGKKTMISPYGFFCSDFDNPQFGEQIKQLKVDIIAYQDEVGCVREEFPMPRLKKHWKLIREIHNQTNIELWANCELFTWEKGVNSRSSALIPAALPRVISQMAAATNGGVERIISFMVYGIWDTNETPFHIGQPSLSKTIANDYRSWLANDERWKFLNASFTGDLNAEKVSYKDFILFDGKIGEEARNCPNWAIFPKGFHAVDVPYIENHIDSLFIRFLNCSKKDITFPDKLYIYSSTDGTTYDLETVTDIPNCSNNRHDTWIDGTLLRNPNQQAKFLRIAFDNSTGTTAIDEIFLNPTLK